MENIREEVVDIRSCIAYLMVKWKILLLALILGVLAGGGFGYMKQKTAAAAPAKGPPHRHWHPTLKTDPCSLSR